MNKITTIILKTDEYLSDDAKKRITCRMNKYMYEYNEGELHTIVMERMEMIIVFENGNIVHTDKMLKKKYNVFIRMFHKLITWHKRRKGIIVSFE